MDRTLHAMRNDLAVAIGYVHAIADGKLTASPERLAAVLESLGNIDIAMYGLYDALAPAPVSAQTQLLTAVIEGSPYAEVLLDEQGRIVLVNAQAETLFGYSRAELLGQPIDVLFAERFRSGQTEVRSGHDLYGLRKDASEVPIEVAFNTLSSGTETFTLAVLTDISDRKRAEELRLVHDGMQQYASDLEELNRELERASRFKTEFVATMSHELRTPLSAIIGAAELLERESLGERARMTVETIGEAAEALLASIDSVLDFSKIEAGKLELHELAFGVKPLVDHTIDVVAHLARTKGIALQAFVDPAIPPVVGDRDRLRQILLNLLANAVKFSDGGRIFVRAVPVESPDSVVDIRFEVHDGGVGIAADVLPRLFEPFAQADRSTSRRYGGTGLGLSICKRLVNLMGGEIGVESTLGSGSLFWFTVPFVRAAESAVEPQHAAHPIGLTLPGAVLVAEDNEQLQRLLQLQFDELGVDVAFVADGQRALDAIRKQRFAMIFMDCQMPNLDGLDATKAIRREERRRGGHVPIAAMTANAFAEDREACLAAGMDDYLAKPVTLAALRAMLERWTTAAYQDTRKERC